MQAPPRTRFTADDADEANTEWGANCGPGAIAAVTGMTLEELKPAMGIFHTRKEKYTNIALMYDVLKRLNVPYQKKLAPDAWPEFGLVRVQWHGPWMDEEAHWRARLRHSHWVGCAHVTDPLYKPGDEPLNDSPALVIFDINCINSNAAAWGWIPFYWWHDEIVPWIIQECEPEGDGKYSLTHALSMKPLGLNVEASE